MRKPRETVLLLIFGLATSCALNAPESKIPEVDYLKTVKEGEHFFEGIWIWSFEGDAVCIDPMIPSNPGKRYSYSMSYSRCFHMVLDLDEKDSRIIRRKLRKANKEGTNRALIRFVGDYDPNIEFSDETGLLKGRVVVKEIRYFAPIM